MLNRRLFIAGLFVAPAIVRATSIMPVKAIIPVKEAMFDLNSFNRRLEEEYLRRFHGVRVGRFTSLMPNFEEVPKWLQNS